VCIDQIRKIFQPVWNEKKGNFTEFKEEYSEMVRTNREDQM
jgi:hypothetical protein